MHIFDQEFSVRDYVEKRLMDIEDLESRRVFKDIVGKLFMELHDEIEREYDGLERRVFNEVPMAAEGPEIITTLAERKDYDVTDKFFRPMRANDIEPLFIDSEALMQSLQSKTPFFFYTVYLHADWREARAFGESGRTYRGVICTDHAEFAASFTVKPNSCYRNMLEELYEIFQVNFLPWRSVCAPYLFKLFDVYITDVERWDPKEHIVEAQINFEEYKTLIRYEPVPLWNISPMMIKTSTYPEPCVDKTNYEHRIFRHKLRSDARYLVTNRDAQVANVRWLDGDLLITCPQDSPVSWDLYQCVEVTENKYKNPCVGNGSKGDFSARLRAYFAQPIKTKQEVARLIISLKVSDLLEFIDVAIVAAPQDKETYKVDYFIIDELRSGKWEMAMQMDFRAKDKNSVINRDVMSFIVGVVQRYFPEYECCGRLL